MHNRYRSSCNRVLLFALAFVAMQTYVLYVSTFHKFHDMPPMCQLCATVEKYENSVAAKITLFQFANSIEPSKDFIPPQVFTFVSPLYHPRAPPLLSS